MVDLNPLHHLDDLNPLDLINKFNRMAGDNLASMMEFLGISDPAVDPDGVREIAKKWRALADAIDDSVKDAENSLKDVVWEGKTSKEFFKRAKKTRAHATQMSGSLRDGADALDKFADEAHDLLTELNVIIVEMIEVEMAGLALSVLTGGASAVVSSLAAGARFAKAMALIGRIEQSGTAMARVIRAVVEVIKGLSRALKALKGIKSVATVGKLAGQGAKFAALDALLRDPGTFKDPGKLAETLAMGAALGVGLGGLSKLLGKGLGKLKPKDLSKLRQAMKLNCSTLNRLKARPGWDKLPASVQNALKKFVRDPIDVATGDMALTRKDVELPGVLPLVLERTHISSYRYGGWFGPSWASTLDRRLQIDEEGVVYVAADGSRLCFPLPDAETSKPVRPETPGSRLILRFAPGFDGALHVNDPDSGLTYAFHSPVPAAEGAVLDLPLQYIEDRNGNRITIEYDDRLSDLPRAVAHSGGYRIALDHNESQGRIARLRLLDPTEPQSPGTTLITFGYDETGRLTDEFDSSGRPLRYTYDAEGRITSWTDRNGTKYWYAYDKRGRVVETGGTGGALASTLSYEDETRTTRVTDSLGHTHVYEHNESFRLTRETDPLGHVVEQEWDDHLRLTARTDAVGRTTRFVYDDSDQPVQVVRPDGKQSTAEYNDLGLPIRVTDPDGSMWVQEFSYTGDLIASVDPAGLTTRYEHDNAGRLTAVIDAMGNRTAFRNNAAGLPVESIDPLGAVSRMERDTFGRVGTFTDPLGARTHLDWSPDGNLISRTAADGSLEAWTYDSEGNCVTYEDPVGGVTHFEYTHFGLLTARTGPDGERYEFTHDTELRLTCVTNPHGLTWNYTFDPAGRLTAETDFDDRAQLYEVDPAGDLAARTTPLGQRITFERNVLGQVVRKNADGEVTTYAYDDSDQLVEARTPGTRLVVQRDVLGRVVSETVAGRTLRYHYDEFGRRTGRTTPSGAHSTWTYDASGHREQLTTSGHRIRFYRDAAGRELSRRIGDTLTLDHAYDAIGRRTSQTVAGTRGQVRHRDYQYRADGNLIRIGSTTGARTFDLDISGRVTGIRARNWSETYSYDKAGNQTYAQWPDSHPGPEARGDRSHEGTRITRAGRVRYEYDAAGRTTLRQKTRLSNKPDTWRYDWDAEDRLTQVVTPDGTVWRYEYDAYGRRTSKLRLAADGDTVAERVDFTWDDMVMCEQTTHAPGPARPVILTWDHEGNRPMAQTETITDAELSQEITDQRFYAIATDLVGTPIELIDLEGDVAWQSFAGFWGATTWSTRSTAYTPLRFPGQYFDPESLLHYNCNRYYDPETARYISPDPLGLAPAPNPVTYVDNPHLWSDPLGLAAQHNPEFPTRREAFNHARDMAGVPRSSQPIRQWEIGGDPHQRKRPNYEYKPYDPMADPRKDPRPGWGRYYQYDTPQGTRVIAEHTADPKAPYPHFHAGKAAEGSPADVNMQRKTYKQVMPKHHIYYTQGPCGGK